MFEQTFKNIDDILYKDSGADSELDYIGQTSWVLFLRYLDELELEKADEAGLRGQPYEFIIDEEYRWEAWAMPKKLKNGSVSGSTELSRSKVELDHHKAMTGPDLVRFVDTRLFPYLAGFKHSADNPQTLQYKIGEIFSELKNKIQSGYNLREIVELADDLPFLSTNDKHELSSLYETKIKNMGNAGRNGGQYYTPRPLIRAMIQVTDPQIGEKVYDGAVGSAGFLCEAYEYMYQRMDKTTDNLKTLQEKTFYGKEKKNLAYIIGVMNMILHGIEAPNIIHTNTLGENIRDIQEKDRYHIILANPPFGGKERPEVQQNFDIKTGETAFLFLQHFIKSLKAGGRAAVVIKNTFLSNTDNASVSLRKHLLESCNLHTVLDMPGGTFLGAGVKTVVLFFRKGEPTRKVWYYQMNPGRNMGKTNSLNDDDLQEFVELQKTMPETEKSWNLDVSSMSLSNGYDLSVKNPNTPEEAALRNPQEILDEMQELDAGTNDILQTIKTLL
jgi:type I restriction enzyme M protein